MIVHQQKISFWNKLKGVCGQNFKLNWLRLKPLLFLLLVINIILVFGGFLLIKIKWTHIKQTFNHYIEKVVFVPAHRLFFTAPEKINIEMSFESLQKIEQKRQKAIADGILLTADEDFVPAKIIFEGKKIPVKLRLKGDWVDHLQGNKWSFRVHTKNNEALMGMRYFSLQAPETRSFLNEWLALRVIRQEGLIALRYKFLEVSINGERKGIYALEEHFSKELIENNQRREGPIIKFSEDLHWANLLKYFTTTGEEVSMAERSLIEPFRGGKTLKDPVLYAQFQEAGRLLQDFRNNQVRIDQTFDLEQWAKFFALMDLFGGGHGLAVQNLRFYYNPVTGLLEPIPFDLMADSIINRLNIERKNLLTDFPQFWQNKVFQEKYMFYLEKYSRNKFVEDLLARYDQEILSQEKIINLDQVYKFNPIFLYQNKAFIQKKLNDQPALKIIRGSDGSLNMTPLTELPLEVLNVPSDPLYIPPAMRGEVPPAVEVVGVPGLEKIKYRFLGTKREFEVALQPWTQTMADNRFLRQSSLPYFVKFQPQENVFRILVGNWQLHRPLVIPKNSKLIIEAGTKLDLLSSSYLVSYSPIFINGSEDNLVQIMSSDGSGGGILVIGDDSAGQPVQTSKISYAQFSGLNSISARSNNISGGVTFYEADVEIRKSLFENNNSEDMLNIVRSKFLLEKVVFSNSFADGLDIDFGRGKIFDSNFNNLTNDAIDISNSQLEIDGVHIAGAGDKGISVGERSKVLLENSEIKDSQIGLASKDGSYLTVKLSAISGGKYGLAIYQKKQEYAGAVIEMWNTSNLADQPYLIEKGSSLYINSVEIKGDSKNVYGKLLEN